MTWLWIAIAAAAWLAIVLVAVGACAASARADRAMEREGAPDDASWFEDEIGAAGSTAEPAHGEREPEAPRHWGVDEEPRVEPTGRFTRRRQGARWSLRPR